MAAEEHEVKVKVDVEPRVGELERTAAVHTEQLTTLQNLVSGLLARVDRFEKRLIIVGCLIFAGTDNGAQFARVLVGWMG